MKMNSYYFHALFMDLEFGLFPHIGIELDHKTI
jgi:hypothetical protein